MCPAELDIKDPTESHISVSYLDLLLPIGRDDQLRTPLYDKRECFNVQVKYLPVLNGNISSSPAMAFFHSSHDMPGLVYLCFIPMQRDFDISFGIRGMSGNFEIVPNEVLWSIWGSYKTIWSPPLPNVTGHFGTWKCLVTTQFLRQ